MAGIERWGEKWDKLDLNEEETIAERKFVQKYSKAEMFNYHQQQTPTAFKQAMKEYRDENLKKRKAKCTVVCEDVTLKLTLTEKFLQRTVVAALVEPYLTAFNKKHADAAPATPEDLVEMTVDGKSVMEKMSVRAEDVFTKDEHAVVLTLKPRAQDEDDDDGPVLEEENDNEDDGLVLEQQ